MYDYLRVKKWRKKRKWKNPLKGSLLKNPWAVASKLTWFFFDAVPMIFASAWLKGFEAVVFDATGSRRPQALPKWSQRITFWLYGIIVSLFFFTLYCAAIRSYHGIWTLSLALTGQISIWFWLRRRFPPTP
ncbi:MAG: hypothetical protein U9Q96_00470 [Patescibacteria group bacterium]|nr:hypothetical protein [Patescibacteria group bacterium]